MDNRKVRSGARRRSWPRASSSSPRRAAAAAPHPRSRKRRMGCDEFSGGASSIASLSIDGDTKAFLTASANLVTVATSLETSVMNACIAIDTDLGVTDTWTAMASKPGQRAHRGLQPGLDEDQRRSSRRQRLGPVRPVGLERVLLGRRQRAGVVRGLLQRDGELHASGRHGRAATRASSRASATRRATRARRARARSWRRRSVRAPARRTAPERARPGRRRTVHCEGHVHGQLQRHLHGVRRHGHAEHRDVRRHVQRHLRRRVHDHSRHARPLRRARARARAAAAASSTRTRWSAAARWSTARAAARSLTRRRSARARSRRPCATPARAARRAARAAPRSRRRARRPPRRSSAARARRPTSRRS